MRFPCRSASHRAIVRSKTLIPNTSQPEQDPDPKKRLFDFIYVASDKRVRYVNAIHNERIVMRLDITRAEGAAHRSIRFGRGDRVRLRLACTAMLCAALWISHGQQVHGAELKSIAILDFDLVDDQHQLSPATVEYQRLRAIRDQLEEEIAANRLYGVVDRAPASALIKKYRSEMQLRTCNGCELDIARALHADRVLVGWVQKVSNLILNINIQIEDAATGAILLNKSVDLRGNTDETWRRGVTYLVRSMVEKNQGNR